MRFVTPGGKDVDTTGNSYFLFPWLLSFRAWLLRAELTKPTPRQNCLTRLICALWDKGMNLAGCQLINRPLMNLCHYQQGVRALLGTCWQREVEDREHPRYRAESLRGLQPPPRVSTVATPKYDKAMVIFKEKKKRKSRVGCPHGLHPGQKGLWIHLNCNYPGWTLVRQ